MKDESIFQFRQIARLHNEKQFSDAIKPNEKVAHAEGRKIAESVVESGGMIFVGDGALDRFNGRC